MDLIPLLDIGGASTNIVVILCAAVAALWGAVIGLVKFITRLYEDRDDLRIETIKEKDVRITALESRVQEITAVNQRSLTALEQSVALSSKQTDVIEDQMKSINESLKELSNKRVSSR